MANASLADQKFYVYVHSRLSSGQPFYIGKGTGKRCISESNRNKYWLNIVSKDQGFVTSFIAQDLDEELAILIEIEAIALYRQRGFGLVNMTNGGEGVSGFVFTEEQKLKMSNSHKGVKLSETHRINSSLAKIGRIVSQQTRDKISKTNKGTKPSPFAIARSIETKKGSRLTEQHRANISSSLKGRPKPKRIGPSPLKGRVFSEETRRKMSIAHLGEKITEERRANLSRAVKEAWARRKSAKEISNAI